MSANEPESYDLNSMVDRLKSRPPEEDFDNAELVTRADGSQMLRVRKRKRRSDQPHKTRQRRVRVLQATAVMVSLLVLFFSFGFVLIYVNSTPFQKKVEEMAARSTLAEAGLNQFRMNPSGANAQGLDLKWPSGNMLESAMIRMLKGKVSPLSFFGSSMSGQELEAAKATLHLRLPEEGMPRCGPPPVDNKAPIHFDHYGIKDFTVMLMDGPHALIRLANSEATLHPPTKELPAKLLLTRGGLHLKHWPKLRLDRALLQFPGDMVDVVNFRVQGVDDEMGFLELEGVFNPYERDLASRLKLTANAIMMSDLVGSKMGGVLVGRLDSDPEAGSCEMRLRVGDQPDATMVLTFRGTPATTFQIKEFPFLYSLSHMLDDVWFSQPEFEDVVRGTLVRTPDKVELRDFDFSSKKRMHIRGQLVMDDATGKLSGSIRVGVDHGMISTADNQVLNQIFGPGNEGFRWMELDISGTAMNPVDNFNVLYEQVLKQLKEGGVPEPSAGGVPTFEELTAPR